LGGQDERSARGGRGNRLEAARTLKLGARLDRRGLLEYRIGLNHRTRDAGIRRQLDTNAPERAEALLVSPSIEAGGHVTLAAAAPHVNSPWATPATNSHFSGL